MKYRLIVSDGNEYDTYVGEVIEWGPETVVLRVNVHYGEPQLVRVALACIVGSEEIAA